MHVRSGTGCFRSMVDHVPQVTAVDAPNVLWCPIFPNRSSIFQGFIGFEMNRLLLKAQRLKVDNWIELIEQLRGRLWSLQQHEPPLRSWWNKSCDLGSD